MRCKSTKRCTHVIPIKVRRTLAEQNGTKIWTCKELLYQTQLRINTVSPEQTDVSGRTVGTPIVQSADLFKASSVLGLQKQTIQHPTYVPTYQLTNQPAMQPTNQPTYQPHNLGLASLPSRVRPCLPSRPSLRTCFPSRRSRFYQPAALTALQAGQAASERASRAPIAAKAASVPRTKPSLVGSGSGIGSRRQRRQPVIYPGDAIVSYSII